jgi:hypothetical protein
VQSKVEEVGNKIDNIDLSAVENKVQEESAAIQNKLDNLNVEVDLSPVAKQGSNADATNSAILDGIERILARSARYDTATGNLQFDNIDLTIV